MFRSFTRLAALACTTAVLALSFAAAPAQAASFTFSNTNCSSFNLIDNGGGNFTLNCQTTAPGTFTCSIGQSISAPTLTQLVTLTATCQNASGSVTYTWSAGGANAASCPGITQQAAPNQNKADLSLPTGTTAVSCSYSLAAVDGAANQASGQKTVSYSTGGGGGGGGGGGSGPISCPGFATTHVLDMNWTPKPQLGYTVNVGGFGPNDAIVVRFTTSASTTSTAQGYIQAAEYQDPPSGRTAALSATPCDFVGLPKVGGGTSAFGPNDGAPRASFTLFNPFTGLPTLLPSTTYYFNISNSTPSTCQTSGSCNMIITLSKPSGS